MAESTRRRTRASRAGQACTIRDAAERADVSTATVSRVLSGGSVGEDLKTRVLEAAQKLNFRPNRAARNLRAGSTHTIGVLIPDIENPFFTSVMCGIEEVVQAAGYSLLLANFNESPERERALLSAFQAEGVSGLIFTASRSPTSQYEQMIEAGIPMVAVSRLPGKLKVDQVTVANEEGARVAVTHLLALGHKRIALVNGPATLSTAVERQRGYERAFADAGVRVPADLVVNVGFRQTSGSAAASTLVAKTRRPTAIFAASNLLTLGALEAIHQRGLKIPQEVAIAGFDDMAWAKSLRPPLTTVAQPALEVGQTAARILLERIQRPGAPRRQVVMETELIVRASCGAGQAVLPR
jgi:LacI family transcriptional regulator